MKLPNAIKATGNNIRDVKAIIMGHLHLDHAGGLEHFLGTNIPSMKPFPPHTQPPRQSPN